MRPDLVLNLFQAFQKQWIEYTTLSVHDHMHGLLMWKCFLVYTGAHQCIIHVYNRNYLRSNRDIFSLQAIWITISIIALAMPSADLVCDLYNGFILVRRQILSHGRAYHGMGLHDLKLFRCQPSRLVQDFLVDTNLTDIVKR